jgi:hypothetical protein
LAFIVANDTQTVDPETRKLIRSHVMRGKNKIKRKKKSQVHMHQPDNLCPKSDKQSLDYCPIQDPAISRVLASNLAAIRFADDVDLSLVADVMWCECYLLQSHLSRSPPAS